MLVYKLNSAAAVLIVVQRVVDGRLRGHRCVAVTGRAAKGKHCTTYRTLTTIVVKHAKAGRNRLKFNCRVHGRMLAAGTYRVLLAAVNRGGWSKPRSAGFAVLRVAR
jgi:hypothetical protein